MHGEALYNTQYRQAAAVYDTVPKLNQALRPRTSEEDPQKQLASRYDSSLV